MNDYSGSLALQTIGVRVRRPVSAVIVTVLAFALILWLHAGDTAPGSSTCCCWSATGSRRSSPWSSSTGRIRARGRATINPAEEHTARGDAVAALVAFVLAYAAAVPFMNTSLIHRSGRRGVARRRHRLLRQFPCRRGSLRRLSALGFSSREFGQVEPRGPVAAPLIQPDRVGVARERAEDQVVDATFVQMRLEPLEQF